MDTSKIQIEHFSDVLCIWAFVSQIRLDELKQNFGDQIDLKYHFTPIFGDVQRKINVTWARRGGFAAYSKHVHSVVSNFEHCAIHPNIWQPEHLSIPASSSHAHLFLKALDLLEQQEKLNSNSQQKWQQRSIREEAAWQLRWRFFHDGVNIALQDAQMAIAEDLGIDRSDVETVLKNGTAMAELMHDLELAQNYQIKGSPTYVLNEGRQKLYGNVGYRVIEVNIKEILRDPGEQASWC